MLTRDIIIKDIKEYKDKLSQLASEAPDNTLVKTNNFYGTAKDVCDSLEVLLDKTKISDKDQQPFFQFIASTLNKIKSAVANPSPANTTDLLKFFNFEHHCFSKNTCDLNKKIILKSKLIAFAGVSLMIGGICAMALLPPSLIVVGIFVGCVLLPIYPTLRSGVLAWYLKKLSNETPHIHIDDTIVKEVKSGSYQFITQDKDLLAFREKLSLFANSAVKTNVDANSQEKINEFIGIGARI